MENVKIVTWRNWKDAFYEYLYFQIYNEEIRDLLGEPKQQIKLDIKENADRGGIYVAGEGFC